MEFRVRNYEAEDKICSLPRLPSDDHPLALQPPPLTQEALDVVVENVNNDFSDPLRALDKIASNGLELEEAENILAARQSNNSDIQVPAAGWTSLKRLLMQKYSAPRLISVTSISNAIVKHSKVFAADEKSKTNAYSDELEYSEKILDEGVKVIPRQEYIARLHELKHEITDAWNKGDRFGSLKSTIKVARLLMDTSVLQFYPTLFVLATDIFDMLGDMVWERIKQKAEFADDGTPICSLPENFKASNICDDAKETCINWFCRIGSIRELLPRIYLELALLPCWSFVVDHPGENLDRLSLMTRGLGDPLASSYCRLYMAYRAGKLLSYESGFLITSINDLKALFQRIVLSKENNGGCPSENQKLLISLMEPSVEYIVKCILKDAYQVQGTKIIMDVGLGKNHSDLHGDSTCVSVVLHHLVKELPTEVVSSNVMDILHLIACSDNYSCAKYMNYRLLGLRLCERMPGMDIVDNLLKEVMNATNHYHCLHDYLNVVDAYLDIVLQNQMDYYLHAMLGGISTRASCIEMTESEATILQSILLKLLSHMQDLEVVFALDHFEEILDAMHGSSQSVIHIHILSMATRKGHISEPSTIRMLFEISQALHDSQDFPHIKVDNNQQASNLISLFVRKVDFGEEMERHLEFLVECRGAFGGIDELKGNLVHSSNFLAIKGIKDMRKHLNFVKSCIAFGEVTISAIAACTLQLNLYLETAEVSLLGGLVSHADGLIASAIDCLWSLNKTDGSMTQSEVDDVVISIQKLCGLLVMVPGNFENEVMSNLKSLFPLFDAMSWTPMIRTKIYCTIVSSIAALSQAKLPYHALHLKDYCNDMLFFGEPSYLQELVSLAENALQNLTDIIQQEHSQRARGLMALDACNCITMSFKMKSEISPICYRLLDAAKTCLDANDKYLQSTLKLLDGNYV